MAAEIHHAHDPDTATVPVTASVAGTLTVIMRALLDQGSPRAKQRALRGPRAVLWRALAAMSSLTLHAPHSNGNGCRRIPGASGSRSILFFAA